MVTVTCDQGDADPTHHDYKMYINGECKAQLGYQRCYDIVGCLIEVGYTSSCYSGNYWNGCIDEFRIYDELLDATAVSDLYDYYFVPEPATMALLGLGNLALLRKRR